MRLTKVIQIKESEVEISEKSCRKRPSEAKSIMAAKKRIPPVKYSLNDLVPGSRRRISLGSGFGGKSVP
ncbi:hypothetical protein HPP92_028703 [Vanilla planifolia]|uniref:Uncharacterized protein n=1 Tax=Vanilla planifolia TaxID=51239 RepID=A0A835P533_VANPL|nr:hypothetical protein HPP92_028703 [Vanilla planifolia]KAG0446728.1 hypothetical protein HPP92_028688 [Vanilla planifolia]